MARPSVYDKLIKPHIADIKKAVEQGATVEEIAKAYGIAESTLYKYKAEKKELKEAFARGREEVVVEIKNALLKKALGFEYVEKKTVARAGKTEDDDAVVMVEEYKRYSPPSETAAAMLLRNYDKTWLDNDQTSKTMKEQKMKLEEAIAKANNFDLELNEKEDKE